MLYLQNFSLISDILKYPLDPDISWQQVLGVLSLILFWGVFGYVTAGKHGDLSIKFGLMDLDEFGEFYVYWETTHVPLYPVEYYPEFRFGYTLDYKDNRSFYSHYVLSLPAPPKIIGEGLFEVERNQSGIVLTSRQILREGGTAEPLAFNESDPLGRWRMDIYVNDTLVRSIAFSVVSPNKEALYPNDD